MGRLMGSRVALGPGPRAAYEIDLDGVEVDIPLGCDGDFSGYGAG